MAHFSRDKESRSITPQPEWPSVLPDISHSIHTFVLLISIDLFGNISITDYTDYGFSSGGSKEIGQNLDNGSENSENQ